MAKKVKEIQYTPRARKDLQKIYQFNCELQGENRAFQLIKSTLEIVDRELLSDNHRDAVDEQFDHLVKRYFKIISGHLKITYRKRNNVAIIVRIFDTRQAPHKNR